MLSSIWKILFAYLSGLDKGTLTAWILGAITRWVVPVLYAKFGFAFTAAQLNDAAAWAAGGVLLLISLVWSVVGRAKILTDTPPPGLKAAIARAKNLSE